jgi:L-threonylcarbamoyladenylate synthase
MPKIINLATTPTSEIIKTAVEVLSRGGLVIFPTETLYGIGADPTNQAAIDKLLQYKSRREGKPLSIWVTA